MRLPFKKFPRARQRGFAHIALIKRVMEQTHTTKGFQVVVDILDKVYEIADKVAEDFKTRMRIIIDELLPRSHYRAIPSQNVI